MLFKVTGGNLVLGNPNAATTTVELPGYFTMQLNTGQDGLRFDNVSNQTAIYMPNSTGNCFLYQGPGVGIRGDGYTTLTNTAGPYNVGVQLGASTKIYFSNFGKGMGYYGGNSGVYFQNSRPSDGPAVWGYTDGALGTTSGGQQITLYWNESSVGINTSTPNGNFALDINGVARVSSGYYKAAGANQNGAIIYTIPLNSSGRLIIINSGDNGGGGNGYGIFVSRDITFYWYQANYGGTQFGPTLIFNSSQGDTNFLGVSVNASGQISITTQQYNLNSIAYWYII